MLEGHLALALTGIAILVLAWISSSIPLRDSGRTIYCVCCEERTMHSHTRRGYTCAVCCVEVKAR